VVVLRDYNYRLIYSKSIYFIPGGLMTYRFVRWLINSLMKLLARVDVEDIENLPATGGYIVVANHLGRMDIPLVYYLLERDDVIILVAEKYRKYGIVRWLVKKVNALWLDRFSSDFKALRNTLERLNAGGVLVIAPEGTRSPTGALIQGKAGAGYLAAKSGLPVVPVAAIGTEDKLVKAELKQLKRMHIQVRVGKPFYLPSLSGRNREAGLQGATDEIMCQIAALLPESYRGVYTDHPRLHELLSASQMEG
jgi:1-acyl-sn-glycerol-3-phosphate acyltransferase